MSFRRLTIAALSVAAVFFISAVVSATVIEDMSLEEMSLRSDAIIHGVVVQSGSRLVLGDGNAEPHTITTVRVLRWLKGGDAPTVTIRERGGTVQDRGMWIAGTPRYAANEEVVLFLERRPERPDEFRTFGLVQGKFQVTHGIGDVPSSVARDLEGIGLARWADDGTMEIIEGQNEPAMHLETFVAFVADVVGRGVR